MSRQSHIPSLGHVSESETHARFMQLALGEARLAAQEGEVPVGAVVVCEGRVVGRGHNQTQRLRDVTAHAEMLALTAATNYLGGKYLSQCTLYVTVEPCPMCAASLAWAQIGMVVYGAPDPKRGFRLFTPSLLHPRTKLLAGVLEEECAALMTGFFQKKRQKNPSKQDTRNE